VGDDAIKCLGSGGVWGGGGWGDKDQSIHHVNSVQIFKDTV
jgi:hypothetical protein